MKKSEREKFLKSVGLRVLEIRKNKSISQEQLANDADIDISTISRVERGIYNPSICKMQDIAVSLGVNLSDFFNNKKPS